MDAVTCGSVYEKADGLAKEVSNTDTSLSTDLKGDIKIRRHKIYLKQQQKWNVVERNGSVNITLNCFTRQKVDLRGLVVGMIREGLLLMISRLRANYYNLRESMARKNYIPQAQCECENKTETIDM